MERLFVCIVLIGIILATVGCGSAPKQAVISKPKELTVAETLTKTEREIRQFEEMKEEHRKKGIENLELIEQAKELLSGEELDNYVKELKEQNKNHLQRMEDCDIRIKELKEFAANLRGAQLRKE